MRWYSVNRRYGIWYFVHICGPDCGKYFVYKFRFIFLQWCMRHRVHKISVAVAGWHWAHARESVIDRSFSAARPRFCNSLPAAPRSDSISLTLLRDAWKYCLGRDAAHCDCCFFVHRVKIFLLTYLLTYLDPVTFLMSSMSREHDSDLLIYNDLFIYLFIYQYH